MVFSADERRYISSLSNPAEAFCASFCCKEALLKALGYSFPFPCCELHYKSEIAVQRPLLYREIKIPENVEDCTVRFFQPFQGEIVAVLHLFGKS